ncbi:AAA family ATPase [uncultured Hyphomicrobium sp.]|jgi:putative DNA primase/helicase|uniref:AAA family ATPase n=1 Tax=uncultured Hyphomicrobium sp. TaxID=194373 RepID=UPI0025DA2F22|nr:AAA family ATPase [uncultured Hyphomicrobium sp.]
MRSVANQPAQHTMLNEALAYRERGFSIIPLAAKGKEAVIKWTPYQRVKPTIGEIKQWFGPAFASRNLGLVTGAASGIVVLDVDKPDEFEEALPRTPIVATGKGYHVLFKHPGFPVGNTSLPYGDIRGDGGYVVAPPSVHPNGKLYEWTLGLDTPLADMPEWLLALAKKPEPVSVSAPANDNTETTPYGKAWFQDVDELAKATKGGRNDLLNRVACKGASLHASGQLDEHEARRALFKACDANGLIRDDGPGSVIATIRSGWETGLRNPRCPAETERTPIEAPKPGKLNLVRLSDVKLEKVSWLWPGVLAKGKLSIFAGEGGVGKSTIIADLAARITTGKQWPACKDRAEIGDVLILQLEDGVADTLKARFIAAGGDPERFHTIPSVVDAEGGVRPFNFKNDMTALTEAVRELQAVRLIVIDPIMGYMGDLNSDKAAEVRKLTTPLQLLAQETNASVLMVAHRNKSQDQSAMNSVQGSGAFTQAVRTAFGFVKDETSANDRRVMSSMKNNLAKDNVSWGYTIEPCTVEEDGLLVETSRIAWETESYKATAEDVLRSNREGGKKLLAAEDFITSELRAGPKRSDELLSKAQASGISRSTFYKASERVEVLKCSRNGSDVWELPKEPF